MFNLILARQQGAQAYWNYETQQDNPYCSYEERGEWAEGFIEARAIDNGDI